LSGVNFGVGGISAQLGKCRVYARSAPDDVEKITRPTIHWRRRTNDANNACSANDTMLMGGILDAHLSMAGIMERIIGAFEARRSFGRILQDVAAKGDKIVVERHGEPIAAVVPIRIYEQWKKRRESFFDQMDQVARRADLSPQKADELAEEAIQAVRASHQRE
jgi:prevent-host-death family protein